METFKQPKNLVLSGNVCENWRRFRQNFEIFMKATQKDKLADDVKMAILLNIMGEEAVEVYNGFNLKEEEKKYDHVIATFEKYCIPKKNVVFERYLFNKRCQEDGEEFENFVNDLRKLASTCEYSTLKEELIRDRIILGIRDVTIQERLLRTEKLTLDLAIEACKAAELTKARVRDLHEKSIDAVNKKKMGHSNKYHDKMRPSQGKFKCRRCNKVHGPRECPAFGKNCRRCGTVNHFEVGCRVRKVKEVLPQEETDDDNTMCIATLSQAQSTNKAWYEEILMDRNKRIKFKLDTGAQVNILPFYMFKLLNKDKNIVSTNVKLESFGGFRINPIGSAKFYCSTKNNIERMVEFLIVAEKVSPILGLNSCNDLNLIKRVDLINLSKESFIKLNMDVFEGLGTFNEYCSIQLNEDAKPISNPPRRVPFAIKERLRQTLNDLESRNIITKINNPTGWINNLVIVEKANKSLRLCLDPKYLNLAIKRTCNVLIPTIEDISLKLSGKSVFSVFDLKDGFWQIRLDEDSSNLCKFSTPFGCYKYNRLPFGLSMAPEYFQYLNEKNFGDIPGVIIYFDDLLIAGSSSEEHDSIVQKVITRARERGIKFNKNKIQFRKEQVKYLGHVFSKNGIQIDSDRIKAIQLLKLPTNKKELQSILGMVNFLRPFIPNLSEMTASLRELLKEKVCFQWLEMHTKALNEIKSKITTAPVLANFDVNKEITIQADASQSGLGCCLLQENRPISFASRSLSNSEKNFAQIEKELLSIVFATTKFHNYIYGRNINVITDHKPLINLLKKNISDIASSRLKRLKIRLLKYNLNVSYTPGKYMFIADLLSRSYLNDNQDITDEWINEEVHAISMSLNITESKKREFQVATANDETLKIIQNYYVNGWPKTKDQVPDSIKFYFKLQEDIVCEDGLLFFKYRLIVPLTLRKYILALLHESHFGIQKTKARAREIVYWPGLSMDIENLISKCTICERYQNSNVKQPLLVHDIPDIPFNKLACDILTFKNRDYLVVQDYYSKWLEIIRIKRKNTEEIISKFKSLFSIHGIPKQIISDNMPFNSYHMKKFSQTWNFEIVTSSPRYPKSNGQAERAVQTAKNNLKKCFDNRSDMELALLEYRNTPIAGLSLSPCQILFNRRTRTKLPIHSNLLKPQISKDTLTKVEINQKRYKYYHDRHVKVRDEFREGQNVLIKKEKIWEPGKVLNKSKTPRSYIVLDEQGQQLRRNEIHLKPTETEYVQQPKVDNDNVIVDRTPLDQTYVNTNVEPTSTENCDYKTRYGRTVKIPDRYKN